VNLVVKPKTLPFLVCLLLSCDVTAGPREDYYRESGLTAESVKQKAIMLLQWSQQLKASGISLPVELYATIFRAEYVLSSDELDQYANELSMLQDTPEKLGTSVLSPIKGNGVGEIIEIVQTYFVGMTLATGSGILVAKHWQHDIHLQSENEGLANFISAETGNPEVRLKVNRTVLQGIHGSPFGLINLPLIEIVEGELHAGDKVFIRYGAGPEGFKLPEFPVAQMVLPLYFRTDPSGHFYTIPTSSFSVVAGPPARINVVAPSIVKTNQLFSLSVRVEDQFGNIASGPAPSLDINLDGVFQHRIEVSSTNVTLVEGLEFRKQGLHNITVRSGGGGLVGYSNPVLVRDDVDLRISWANLHAHSNRSDGLQSVEEIEDQASGIFDVALVTDHDNYFLFSDSEAAREISQPLARGGHRLKIPHSPPIVIALPEIPSDHRSLFSPSLVEIRSGTSSYEWFGQHFAGMGYRVGFAGSQTSHLSGRNREASQTAILISGDESWKQAVSAHRTYVTSGPRSILLANLNGGHPGSRVHSSSRRHFSGEVYATAGIDAIELIRNGTAIDRYNFKDTEGARQVKITLGSDSRPVVPGWDIPRNGREWLGYLRVIGAHVSSISASGIERSNRSAIAINPNEPSRIDFITWTHGTESSFVISLDEITDQEVMFEINIKEGFEDVDLLPEARKPAVTQGFKQLLSLNDIGGDNITRVINVDGYSDFVRFEMTNTDRPSHQSFSFVDTRMTEIGDYYYVRVKQVDDHILWSSPIYVGGFDVQ
jgi:hypothetical protein|tara:strand:- start:6777 stop:9083 length:2307 start_codon:yes stop_codon:yes gene_type:complete